MLINDCITRSFNNIAPFWPLKNLITVNPLQGLEDLPIEHAFTRAAQYFQQTDLPKALQVVNKKTIKWLQLYCDQGQATLTMPMREEGFYLAFRNLASYDAELHQYKKEKQIFLRNLPKNPTDAIKICLLKLNIDIAQTEDFFTLLLTTLPGWASYVQYQNKWLPTANDLKHSLSQVDFIAVRVIMTTLISHEIKSLLKWQQHIPNHSESLIHKLNNIEKKEKDYQLPLIQTIAKAQSNIHKQPVAQFVFCIDVRSEPFRRAIESTGNYETLGFAGFFGVPVNITDKVTGENYDANPVLIKPQQHVSEPLQSAKAHQRVSLYKRLYQSLKYNFITPLVLVETIGMATGVWMLMRQFFPSVAYKLKKMLTQIECKASNITTDINTIPLNDQCTYGENALKMIGLTQNFAPIVVLCGHGSCTQNNAFATALDCGACGGHRGGSNARILATILNHPEVREYLASKDIMIPEKTYFIAGEHNTTTDEVIFYNQHPHCDLSTLKNDLLTAQKINNQYRLNELQNIQQLAQDWSTVRPEWGLAKNAAFIVAPRHMTQDINLQGRAFLHSYDYTIDKQGEFLKTILTAPMVVAQWINAQYLFSTLDNVAFGAGSKITQNITGKIAIMQGNASDLMTGLALQSVMRDDDNAYHQPLRLCTIVYAPRKMLNEIIAKEAILQKLFSNAWVKLVCIEPTDRSIYFLQRDLSWTTI